MLEGVRIIDLTHRLAGPFATMILAQMGAEVLKIESPEGDLTRASVPHVRPGVSEYFATFNQAKRSVCINLRHERGREAFFGLAKASDAMIDNFRPGVLARLGITDDVLREVNPRLVSVSLSGFGSDGPDRDRPALDILIQGQSGLMSITGEPDGRPMPAGIAISDMAAGLYGAIAVLGGLVGRDRGHQAGRASISMLQAQLQLMNIRCIPLLNRGEPPERLGAEGEHVCPYGVFPTADGWINIACRGEDFWQEFLKRMDLTQLAVDPRFRDNLSRLAHREAVNRIFSDTLRLRATAAWMARFEGLLAGPINSAAEAFANPHVQATGGILDVKEGKEVALRVANNPIVWLGESTRSWLPGRLGADTAEVLTTIAGFSQSEVEEMAQVGAVVTG